MQIQIKKGGPYVQMKRSKLKLIHQQDYNYNHYIKQQQQKCQYLLQPPQKINLSKSTTQSTTKTQSQTNDNLFLIRKLGAGQHDPSITIDFTPKLLLNKNESNNNNIVINNPQQQSEKQLLHNNLQYSKNYQKIIPVYNINDKNKCYTPTFAIPYDNKKSIQHQHLYQAIHFKKLIQAIELFEDDSMQKDNSLEKQNTQPIYVPKPSKKNRCCMICKMFYQDYLTHVNTPNHQKDLRCCQFNNDILKLCQIFKNDSCDISNINKIRKRGNEPTSKISIINLNIKDKKCQNTCKTSKKDLKEKKAKNKSQNNKQSTCVEQQSDDSILMKNKKPRKIRNKQSLISNQDYKQKQKQKAFNTCASTTFIQ